MPLSFTLTKSVDPVLSYLLISIVAIQYNPPRSFLVSWDLFVDTCITRQDAEMPGSSGRGIRGLWEAFYLPRLNPAVILWLR